MTLRDEYARQEAELDDLYREIILDHYRNPRHKGSLTSPSARHQGLNPLCGDEITIDVLVEDGRIADIAYNGSGCSISQSSASMMTEAVLGKTVADVRHLIQTFTEIMRGADDFDLDELGDLQALIGVRKFPVRVKCATLAWHTLAEALEEAQRAPRLNA
jgi:nitrogen fixation NifU-like protein